MNRDEALALIDEKVTNENLVRHMIATEAIMGALAERLGENREQWAMAGLLHDLDADETAELMQVHGLRTVEWLAERGYEDAAVLQAIKAHNPENGSACSCVMDQAIVAVDRLSGLVTAAALVLPDKKLALVKEKSLRKRFKEPTFARGASRKDIASCEALGVPLEDFLSLGLHAMQGVADELGL